MIAAESVLSLLILRISQLQIEESFECTDRVGMVDSRHGFASRVHSPDRLTHVYASQVDLRRQNIAKSRTAGHIAVVDEVLAGHTGLLANGAEHGCRLSIGHILAIGIDFDDRTATDHRVVRRVILLAIVGMESMGIVSRHHKRRIDAAQIILITSAETLDDALEKLGKHRRRRALLRARPRLLVVKDSHDARLLRRRSFEQRSQRTVNHA